MPKRCGHFDSHRLVSCEQMQSKISAMAEARDDQDLLLIARTDARSVHSIGVAIRRARAYVEAGADVIFIEAPRTVEELARVGRELREVPLVVNVVEGGKTPQLSLTEYGDMGFNLVLYANFLLRSMAKAGQDALAHLRQNGGSTAYLDRLLTWPDRQALVNLEAFAEAEARLDRLSDAAEGHHEARP